MTPQSENSSPGPADVAKKQLQQRRCPNRLHAGCMLRPTDRVAKGPCPVRPGIGPERLGDLLKSLSWSAAYVFHQLRGVPAIVVLQNLKDAARMIQLRVLSRTRADQLPHLCGERLPLPFARNGVGARRFLGGFSFVAPLLDVVFS